MTGTEDEVTRACSTGVPPEARVVAVYGNLDLHRVEAVRSALLVAITHAPSGAEVIVDLTYSSFCDSSGLAALVTARERAADAGHTLRLGAPCHQMLRLMELTGTVGSFAMGPAPAGEEPAA
ncbi:STAS domain-containing protein [Streptomyces sp. NPDC127049]|uniref:STAS domain-containing protein n=1 Tax=Streptomyces sp. NPDC127049 TaxID=3347118 RepID=UPI0036667D8A